MENKLQILNSKPVIISLEVAEMLGKEHSDLLKEIEGRKDGKNVGIIPVLEKGNFHLSDFFIPDTYKSGTREYKCYQITKIGCELIGNKQQGEKGILFTAKYVERFNQMQEHILKPKLLTATEQLELQLKIFKEHDQRMDKQDKKIDTVYQDVKHLNNDMPLFTIECKTIQSLVRKIGTKMLGGHGSVAYKNNSVRGKVYADIQGQLKREFGVARYEAIKRCQIQRALEILANYKLPVVLEDKISILNSQVKLEAV